ncbi:MAG: histidinol-phosphatase [Myxococcota bacterium]|nr:histidinol-phosphatase [Myxococcota bacterium]
MTWFSYHGGHSGQFCRHAKGRLREVVLRAIEAGFTHYGLSEHAPRDETTWLFPDEQDLTPEDLAAGFVEYAREAHALREEFSEHIELLVGFETEMLPPNGWAERMLELQHQGPFEYMLGSVHNVGNDWIDVSPEATVAAAERAGSRQALELGYFRSLADLVTSLRPQVVGHLDLIRKFDGPSADFEPAVRKQIDLTLEAVREVRAILDVNAGAHRRGLSPVYPLPFILERARQMNIGVTLGDDGHGPHDVGVGLDACMKAIASAGYRQVHYLCREGGEVVLRAAPIDEVRPNL